MIEIGLDDHGTRPQKQAQEAALARVEASTQQTPLEFWLEIMRDTSYPPGARIECAKAAWLRSPASRWFRSPRSGA